MNKTLLIKHLSGKASDKEKAAVMSWLQKSEYNRRYLSRLKELTVISGMENTQAKDCRNMKDTARKEIGIYLNMKKLKSRYKIMLRTSAAMVCFRSWQPILFPGK